MVVIYIDRFKEIEDGTLSDVYVEIDLETVYHCYGLEPIGPDCVESGKDRRIPKGLYLVDWHSSPRFKKSLPRLYSDRVSKDRCILIHAGNYPGDTEGCILLGKNYNDKGVFNSREALDKVIGIIRPYDKIEVHISNEGLL